MAESLTISYYKIYVKVMVKIDIFCSNKLTMDTNKISDSYGPLILTKRPRIHSGQKKQYSINVAV